MEDGLSVTTVIVGVLAGAGGAVLGTLLRATYEREENFRHRLIDAADDFSLALGQALIELNAAHELFLSGARTESTEPLSRAQDLIHEAHIRLSRVDMLFGDESRAGSAANEAIVCLRKACRLLGDASAEEGLDAYEDAYDAANVRHLEFCRAVLISVRPWWRRMKATRTPSALLSLASRSR